MSREAACLIACQTPLTFCIRETHTEQLFWPKVEIPEEEIAAVAFMSSEASISAKQVSVISDDTSWPFYDLRVAGKWQTPGLRSKTNAQVPKTVPLVATCGWIQK